MIELYHGNIFEAPVDIIIHQANCFNTMSAGIAKRIKQIFPEAYKVDLATKRGDKNKLGTFSIAASKSKIIINLYGQYMYGRDKCYTDYRAVKKGLIAIKEFVKGVSDSQGEVIGIPYGMGCVNAGGDWQIVERLIREVFEKSKFKVLICRI